jgi:ABC-type transport system involved in multi-copper enzyme maturation permease subunit
MLVWLIIVAGNRHTSAAHLSQTLFIAFGVVALAFCLLAGVFLTSDCLSEEKREGTLGLLFLTDLKGYDVVLGKLIATSTHSIYGLLAVFPILGLPLLMGGVTGAEFWRVVLVLLVTLFLSLSLGMIVSSIAREARQAMGATLLGMLLLAGVLPAFWWLQTLVYHRSRWNFIMLPSPVHAFIDAFDQYYSSRTGSLEFWLSLLLLMGLGVGLILIAGLLLPRVWQEKVGGINLAANRATSGMNLRQGQSGAPEELNSGTFPSLHPSLLERSPIARGILRLAGSSSKGRAVLEPNPYHWLASRSSSSELMGQLLFLLLCGVWAAFLVVSIAQKSRTHEAFVVCLFTTYGLHQVGKYFAALETSRQLSEDRLSGALELLLVTPLKESEIRAGHLSALRKRLGPLKALLALMNLAMFLTVLVFSRHLDMDRHDQTIFAELFLGGIVCLFADFRAFTLVGMWMALRSKRHPRAVLGTLLRVMGVPWAAVFLLVFLMMNSRGISQTAVGFIFAFWFAIGLVSSLAAAGSASANLRVGLRRLVSEGRAERFEEFPITFIPSPSIMPRAASALEQSTRQALY